MHLHHCVQFWVTSPSTQLSHERHGNSLNLTPLFSLTVSDFMDWFLSWFSLSIGLPSITFIYIVKELFIVNIREKSWPVEFNYVDCQAVTHYIHLKVVVWYYESIEVKHVSVIWSLSVHTQDQSSWARSPLVGSWIHTAKESYTKTKCFLLFNSRLTKIDQWC